MLPRIVFAAIYEDWVRCHNGKPDIEFGHFFANPVRITPTGPTTIRSVMEAHHSLCAQVSDLIHHAQRSADGSGKKCPLRAPQCYSLGPLYRAIIVIVDGRSQHPKVWEIESDGSRSLRKIAQNRTVLIARTGVEEGRSAPVSFHSIRTLSHPLELSDTTVQGVHFVRVSLAVAVRFVADLETTENPANAKMNVCDNPDDWANAVINAADEYGYRNVLEASHSIEGVQSYLNGEDPSHWAFEHEPFGMS